MSYLYVVYVDDRLELFLYLIEYPIIGEVVVT